MPFKGLLKAFKRLVTGLSTAFKRPLKMSVKDLQKAF